MGCGGSSHISQPSCAKIWFLTCPLQKDSYSFVKTAVYGATRGAPLGCSRGPKDSAPPISLCVIISTKSYDSGCHETAKCMDCVNPVSIFMLVSKVGQLLSPNISPAITSQEITCPLQPAAKDKIRTTYLYVISKTVSEHQESL